MSCQLDRRVGRRVDQEPGGGALCVQPRLACAQVLAVSTNKFNREASTPTRAGRVVRKRRLDEGREVIDRQKRGERRPRPRRLASLEVGLRAELSAPAKLSNAIRPAHLSSRS